MIITHTIKEVAAHSQRWHLQQQRVGFVPTMGNLHEGHMDLFRTIAPHCDRVVCSIFANPLQFGENEDYGSYPRTMEGDIAKLQAIGADCLFAPSVAEMYGPKGLSETKVSVKRLNNRYCGAVREGHFIGVATVVCKLFNIVAPNVAVFGEKDFQQLAVIRQMTSDLSMQVQILASPTHREASGLAFSSRNQYLTAEQRKIAPQLYGVLNNIRQRISEGDLKWDALTREGLTKLKRLGFSPEFLEVADAETLDKAAAHTRNLVVLVAARLGKARLIDNVHFSR